MKKITKLATGLLGLSLLAGVAVGVVAVKSERAVKAEAAGPGYQTYVPVRSGWIEWTGDGEHYSALDEAAFGRKIRLRDARFWSGNSDPNNADSQERTYNAVDDFVDTFIDGGDGWRGNYRTPELTLHDNDHRYICFNYSGSNTADIFLNVWRIDRNGEDVIKNVKPFFDLDPDSGNFDSNKGKENDEDKKNAPISCNQTFRYLELPSGEHGINAGERFLVFVHDGSQDGYGFFTFGGLYINQSFSDVARHFSTHKAQMLLNKELNTTAWNNNAIDYTLKFYKNDDYYADLRTEEAKLTDADDGFEVNTQLSNWAYDHKNSTYNDGAHCMLDFSGIYSDRDYKDWRQKQPANKTGDMYLNADTSGIPEDAKYRVVSSAFKLNDLGLVSIKMGGNSSKIELLDADTLAVLDGVANPNFKDVDANNIIKDDTRQNTMTRLYIDWSAYKYSTYNKLVRIAISDCRTGGNWGLAYFDELITKHDANNLSFKVDRIVQEGETDLGDGNWASHDKYYGVVLDTYQGSATTNFGRAYAFVRDYFAKARAKSASFSWCNVSLSSDEMVGLKNAYNTLASSYPDAKAIVDASMDFSYGVKNPGTDYWLHDVDTSYTIAQSMAYLISNPSNATAVIIVESNISQSSTTLIIVIASLAVVAGIGFVLFKKKRQ